MAGRKSLLSFGFSSNRAQQAASAGNSGLLPLDPAPNTEPGEIPGLEGSQSPSGPSEQPSGQLDQPDISPSLCRDYKKFDYQRAMELHDSMHNSLISSLARKVDQLQFAAFDEVLANEDLVDFTPLPESEPEEETGFDFSETEDEEEAAAEDDELSQAAVHGQSATIDLDENDGLGEALGFF